MRVAAEAAWAEAGVEAPFCLEHVVALVDRRSSPAWWAAVEARQVARLGTLGERLGGFAHASAHDRRHLQTREQVDSVDEAADVLGGPATDQAPSPRRRTAGPCW